MSHPPAASRRFGLRYFSLLPLVCFAVFIGYACYGAWHVGDLPYYAHPDPKELPHRPLLRLVSTALLIGLVSLPLLPVGYTVWRALIRWRNRPLPSHRKYMLWYLAGACLWVLDFGAEFVQVPWFSTISWILD